MPEYRRRGLVRAQFDVIHQWSAARGQLVQVISGIPFYYCQFGYEMGLALSGGRGHRPAVDWLLARGAAVDLTGCYNNETLVQITPYVAAVHYRRAAVAAVLLAHGAQADIFRAAFLGAAERVAAAVTVEPGRLMAEDPHDLTYDVPLLAFAVAGGAAWRRPGGAGARAGRGVGWRERRRWQ